MARPARGTPGPSRQALFEVILFNFSFDFHFAADMFPLMTKTFTLINEEEGTREIVQLNPETSSQDALLHLGFMITPFDDSGEVKEYSLIDDDSTIFTFFSFFYENACFEALDRLGYSLYEGEVEQDQDEVQDEVLEEVQKPFNIIQFSLGA